MSTLFFFGTMYVMDSGLLVVRSFKRVTCGVSCLAEMPKAGALLTYYYLLEPRRIGDRC